MKVYWFFDDSVILMFDIINIITEDNILLRITTNIYFIDYIHDTFECISYYKQQYYLFFTS